MSAPDLMSSPAITSCVRVESKKTYHNSTSDTIQVKLNCHWKFLFLRAPFSFYKDTQQLHSSCLSHLVHRLFLLFSFRVSISSDLLIS